MNKSFFGRVAFPLALCAAVAFGCSKAAVPKKKGEVEISPGTFIVLESSSGSTDSIKNALARRNSKYSEWYELSFQWSGRKIQWRGNSIPINLREFKDRLYLISFDRVSKGAEQSHFRYYVEHAGKFEEIDPKDFPKAIAGQNMAMGFATRHITGGPEALRENIKMTLDQNPAEPAFRNSMTAFIWAHLAAGQQYYESTKSLEVNQSLLEDYIRAHHPIRLTAIVRDGTKGILKSK